LRYTNIFWVGLFYLTWIYYSFPRLLRGFQPWFLASLLLLVMPGYQKLGVMSHPDNMFAGTAGAAIAMWLYIRERWQARTAAAMPIEAAPSEISPASRDAAASVPSADAARAADLAASSQPRLALSHLIGFALAIGLMALTRPFAAVPTAVLSVVCAVYVLRSARGSLLRQLPRLLLVGTIIGVMSVSWYAYRWKKSGEVTNAYRTGYISKFEKRRANFDYRSYYTTLNLHDLIVDPSRKMGDGEGVYADTPLANSFFTLLYSEIWGDQWLYFSGPKMRDNKVWPKRMLLVCALAVPPTMLVLGLLSLWALIGRIRKKAQDTSPSPFFRRLLLLLAAFEPELVLLSIALLGAALFVYWQGGPALLPGKNSTVKFIYIATLFPPAIALVFGRRLRPVVFNVLSGYFLVLYVVAYPVAMYWPQ